MGDAPAGSAADARLRRLDGPQTARAGDAPRVERPYPGGPIRIAVLVSGRGRGTNLRALLTACEEGRLAGEVAVVISTTPGTPALEHAAERRVPARVLSRKAFPDDDALDQGLLERLGAFGVDLICLAGYMRKVGPRVREAYRWRIMNIHPSLIPAFSGQGMYGMHVHEAVLDYGAKVSGVTVQFVGEEYDSGPIILQRCVAVHEDDTPETLAARILPVEHASYVEAIALFAAGRLEVIDGRRVRVNG